MSLLFSCNKEEKAFILNSKSFVLGYYELESLQLYEGDKHCIKVFENTKNGLISINSNKNILEQLNFEHNDLTYNREVQYYMMPNIYITPDFHSVSIISDADYNEDHLAGTSLSNITRFMSISPMRYIQSGYEDTFDWKTYTNFEEFLSFWPFLYTSNNIYHYTRGAENVYPIDSKVSELTSTDLSILGRGVHVTADKRPNGYPLAVIKFIEEPTISKEHNFTVTFTDLTGKEYKSNSLKIEF